MTEQHWSWTQLVKQYGEDEALMRLADMKGYGQFQHSARGPVYDRLDGVDQPRNEHANAGCPICGGNLNNRAGCWQ